MLLTRVFLSTRKKLEFNILYLDSTSCKPDNLTRDDFAEYQACADIEDSEAQEHVIRLGRKARIPRPVYKLVLPFLRKAATNPIIIGCIIPHDSSCLAPY